MITESTLIALAGLIGIMALLFLLITKFKWHVFLALLAPILIFAAIPGIDRTIFIEAFEQGFGGTIESIAVVIVLGSLLAEALKHTGGVERVTASMIGWVGKKRMPLALTLSGFVIGIAIFSDVGYVILNPLVHSAALSTGTNMSVMATGLVGALPFHILAIVAMGMPIIDNADLEKLSEEASRLGRWEFLLTAAPLAVPGGTGSPLNPIATF